MKRIQQPYLLKYYLPCIAIVTVTQISFYIPPDAIPGRIALLVTQFLTLTNLFISEQVISACAAYNHYIYFYFIFLCCKKEIKLTNNYQ